jgi:predicted branched-subunit amino acid permease
MPWSLAFVFAAATPRPDFLHKGEREGSEFGWPMTCSEWTFWHCSTAAGDSQLSLIENERTKLLANALDRASTASLTVGVFAPVAAIVYGASGTVMASVAFVLGASSWLSAAAALHWLARRTLGGLKA